MDFGGRLMGQEEWQEMMEKPQCPVLRKSMGD